MMKQKIETDMRDWCGLPVCVGDTVLFVSTIQPRLFHMFDYIDPETKKLCRLKVMPNAPQIWAWNETWKSEVFMFEGSPHITAPNPEPTVGSTGIMVPVQLFWDMYKDQTSFTGNIFAIEGVSDNQEKYFRHFFKKGIINQN